VTIANVVLYAALIAFILYRRITGRPVTSVKQLFLLPVILTVVGYQDLAHAQVAGIDQVVGIAGAAMSLGFGALRGWCNKISLRNGLPWVRWGAASVGVLAANVVAKLALDAAGVAAGGSTSGVTSSLLLAVGLMLVGEAGVVFLRLQATGMVRAAGPMAGTTRHDRHNRHQSRRAERLSAGW
jgi:hypothetical protein